MATGVDPVPELPGPDADTFWNGEPCEARQVRVVVADAPFPAYWARPYVGQERDAVEVVYHGKRFYLDDDPHKPQGDELHALITRGINPENFATGAGSGWAKVTLGQGGPRFIHRELEVRSVRDRDMVSDPHGDDEPRAA